MDITRFHAAFFEESREGLDAMEGGLLSLESGGDKKMEGKAAGATGWLVKPFDPEQLLATVKRVLG